MTKELEHVRRGLVASAVSELAEHDHHLTVDANTADQLDNPEEGRALLVAIRNLPAEEQDLAVQRSGWRDVRQLRRAVDGKVSTKDMPGYMFFALKRQETRLRLAQGGGATSQVLVIMQPPPTLHDDEDDVIDVHAEPKGP